MKKLGFFLLSFILIFTVGCENKVEESNNENTNAMQEEVKKESKVTCSGPMVGSVLGNDSGIVDDKMVIYATYDSEEKLQGIFYDYEFTFEQEFEGKALETLKSGLNKICENKIFSDCNVNVEGTKATVHTELDSTELKESNTYNKDAFKKEISTLGKDFNCVEE